MKFKSFFSENNLPGGAGDDLTSQDVDKNELDKGISHEMEHTHDEELAKEIALDHLAENPSYYSDLDEFMPEDPNIGMSPGGSNQVPLGGIVAPQAFSVSINGTSVTGDSPTGVEGGVHQPGDVSKITAAGKTDKSFVEKTVGGPVAPGEGQEQGGPNSQGTIANTPENNDIEGSDAPGGTPKNPNIMGNGSDSSTPKNITIGEDGNTEFSRDDNNSGDVVLDASDPESPEFDWKKFGGSKPSPSDYKQEQKLKEIIKKEIKSVLKEMWMGWQHHESVTDGDVKKDHEFEKMSEVAPPNFPTDLEDKIKKQYGSDSPEAFATMWKIHNKGWVDEIQNRLSEIKKK